MVVQGEPRQRVHKTPFQPIAGCGGAGLSSQVTQELRSEKSWFQASEGKNKFMRSHFNNKKSWA
jgi:hypothetical protein